MRPISLNLFDLAFLSSTDAQPPIVITPTSFGQPYRWYDANSLEYLTNDAAITDSDPWDDKSPADDDAVSTSGHFPTFRTNIINGRPTVRLAGTQRLVFEGGDLVLGDFTILCVAIATADSIYMSKAGINRQIRINRIGERRASWFCDQGQQEVMSDFFTSNANNGAMIGHRRTNYADPIVANRQFAFFDNSIRVGIRDPEVTQVNNVIFSPSQIGIIDGGPLLIDIGEIVIYDRALSDGEVMSLYTEYFKPKFGLP